MERRFFLMSGIAATTSTLLPKAFALDNVDKGKEEITHSVYFWLKKGITANEEKAFLNYFEILKHIPGLSSIKFGKPAKTTERDVTDNTFDYNLIITFENLEAINAYEKHPEHLKGAKEYEHFWERVQVRDTLVLL